MVSLSFIRVTVILGCLILLLTWSDVTATAGERDPTKPSSEIESRLTAEYAAPSQKPKAAHPTTLRMPPFQPRLRGMVLRDGDHGTALISIDESPAQWISLRRKVPGSPQEVIVLGGANLVVVDFTETTIVLETFDGSRRYLVQ